MSVVESDSMHTELSVQFQDASLVWNEDTPQVPMPFGDLSNWFSFSLHDDGRLSTVYHPAGESAQVLAFKKSVVKLLDIGRVVERTIEGTNTILTEEVSQDRLSGSKVSCTFNYLSLNYTMSYIIMIPYANLHNYIYTCI